MKKMHLSHVYSMAWIGALFLLIQSCKYQKVEPSSYPDQKIYMATAANANPTFGGTGVYAINAVAVQGQTYRYSVDLDNNKFNVLLGVVRSGVTLDGDVNVDVQSSTDTVNKLISKGVVLTSATQLLPTTAYTITPSVSIPGGASSSTFPLVVDLNFLLSHPNQKYAIAISISSTQRTVNPALATTVVLIDTQFLIPTANFTPAADPGNSKKINFTNSSGNGVSYLWDFGDGTEMGTEKSPSHVYSAAGPYNVKLTVSGAAQKVSITKSITVL